MAVKAETASAKDTNTRFWQKINLVVDLAAYCRGKAPSRETFQGVLKLIRKLMMYDGASLYLNDQERESFSEAAHVGESVAPVSFLRIGRGPGLAGWAASSRKPVLLSNRPLQDEFDGENKFRTIMIVPLLVNDDVIGVLNFGHHHAEVWKDKDVKLMTVVADQLAVSIERQFYHQRLEQMHTELIEAHKELERSHEQRLAAEKLDVVLRLAEAINHQINNPLAVILGNLQCLLLEEDQLTQKTISRLRRMETSCLQIQDVNRQLLHIDDLEPDNFLALTSAVPTSTETHVTEEDKSSCPTT